MTKRFVIFLCCFLAAAVSVMAQDEINTNEIGTDTAQQKLKEVSVTKFEDAGLWYATMPRDQGSVILRRIESDGSLDKEPIPDEVALGIVESDKYVMGLKVQFYKRGLNYFSLYPVRALPVEGITKTLSIWVVGRNTKHVLKVIISDHFGHKAEITMGQLNFSGWKKLTAAIPTSIVQRDYHYNNKMGIKVEGFKVECDAEEAFGTYYIYFDDMRAVTDLFAEQSRDIDDLQDNW